MQSLNHQAIVGETLPYLKANEDEFDIIVLDPPAFAKSMNAKHKALQGYQKSTNWLYAKSRKTDFFSPILVRKSLPETYSTTCL